jgi:hypothetical protein
MPDRIHWLSTVRVGQLTGSSSTRDPAYPDAVDPLGWPLLNDTGRWSVTGVDMGANTEHRKRLYIIFGDVAVEKSDKPYSNGESVACDNPMNSDLVAWTDEIQVLNRGGHQSIGWHFRIPNNEQGATDRTGQKDWRFCTKCCAMFWAPQGDVSKSVCTAGGEHSWLGLNFYLPNDHQGATDQTGQKNWRFCGQCHSLFWAPDSAPAGACPAGGKHEPRGWNFYLPNTEQGATDQTGQKDWRFCVRCQGLFFDGFANKGVCPGAMGGGFHINPVLRSDGKFFAPFSATDPIGDTESLEVASGTFSFNDRLYVFTNISEWKYSGVRRIAAGDPVVGQYLVSNPDPAEAGPYQTEFLFSPRIGRCPTGPGRQVFESHNLRGFRFVLPHSRAPDANHQGGWRYCQKCEMLFSENSSANVCWKGGRHETQPGGGSEYFLPFGVLEDAQNQANWHQCGNCASLFFNGDHSSSNCLCPAGGNHVATGVSLVIPHASSFALDEFHDGPSHQSAWRFCGKCAALYFDDPNQPRVCPSGEKHEAWGLNFVLPHDGRGIVIPEDQFNQKNWRCCEKCQGIFWDGDAGFKGICPADGRTHSYTDSLNFVLHHDEEGDAFRQPGWSFCTKCAGLFWTGAARNVCPVDRRAHHTQGFNFVLTHNPGEDPLNQERWRFCTKCFGMVFNNWLNVFPGGSPVVIQNADHGDDPGFPEKTGSGLAIFCQAYSDVAPAGIRLAWLPLRGSASPRLEDLRYFTGLPGESAWSTNQYDIRNLFDLPNHWTSVSVLWFAAARRWVLAYCGAIDDAKDAKNFQKPVYVRISETPWGLARAEEIELFNPHREGAYGTYMHMPGRDGMHLKIPPLPDNLPGRPVENLPGWAYGAFLLERFSKFDADARELNLYYLLSFGRPYQVQVMNSRLRVLDESFQHLTAFYGGNGTTSVDSGLPLIGVVYAVAPNGDLLWYRYNGQGDFDPSGSSGRWDGNSGNPIGNGWQSLKFVVGCGDGIILGVDADGILRWYCYNGNGESDASGNTGWHPNSGNPIGNGWGGFLHLITFPQEGRSPNHLKLLAVAPNGDLFWYCYEGNGESDESGNTGWHPNSGNRIGNGWQGFRRLHGSGNVIFGVQDDGDLLWHSYIGDGEDDPSGNAGWESNSGNAIGNGWLLGFRHIFGGITDAGGFGHVLYTVADDGTLRWYKYEGNGEADRSGNSGWNANSGNIIGNGW